MPVALQFHPKLGQIVICDYGDGFVAPEMLKRRLAIVVSKRLPHRDGLCTVVPLSMTAPDADVRYQCKVTLPCDFPGYEGRIKWAKADMLATVGLSRLTLPRTARDPSTGKRRYLDFVLQADELTKVRAAMLHALCLDALTIHL
jgi:mRNA interferase MazF